MSYDHTFDDYIKQLRLVRSARYFPSLAAGAGPGLVVRPPPTPYECDYSFEAEYAARRAHEAYARAKVDAAAAAAAPAADSAATTAPPPPPHRASPVDGRVSLPSTSHAVLHPMRGTPVLQPSRTSDIGTSGSALPSVSSSSSLASSAAATSGQQQQQPDNFEDFEQGSATIFDELHMKSIDDRRALNEIWGAVQVLPNSCVSFNAAAAAAAAAPAPAAAAPVPAPRSTPAPLQPAAAPVVVSAPVRQAPAPPPVAAAATVASAAPPALPRAPKPLLMNGAAAATPAATAAATSPPTLNDSRASLAAKLTAKGFRSHVVQLALATLAHEQLPYVEYYIKATSNLEKLKLPADRGLAFLIECRLTDKQEILRHADAVGQLAGMGFPLERCMKAAKEAKGDRVKALDVCLALP